MRLIVDVWLREPEIPLMVTVVVPSVAVLLAARIKVLALVAGFGLIPAMTPLPWPLADSVTLPVKPFEGTMVIVTVAWYPRLVVTLVGEADRLKSGVVDAVTVNVTVVACVIPPPEPVTVIG